MIDEGTICTLALLSWLFVSSRKRHAKLNQPINVSQNDGIDWNRQRGYFWEATYQWLLFDFRQKIIHLFILIFFLANGTSPSKLTQHVKRTFLQFKLSLWFLKSVLLREDLISCDHCEAFFISIHYTRQLSCTRDLYHNFIGYLLMTVMIPYIWHFSLFWQENWRDQY